MEAIDLFAGFGGNTIAAKNAGLDVIWAANHNQTAVEYHELNHPTADHKCQDLQQADWSLVPKHDFMLASPCCGGHTKARGKEGAHHYTSRSTAWAPMNCAEYHRPDLFLVENVKEFVDRWSLYKHWEACMTTLGYSLTTLRMDSADYGVPQNRERVYIVGTQSKHPLQIELPKEQHVPISNVIDLNSGKWSKVRKKGRAKATLERVKNGRAKFGEVFVMPYNGRGSGTTGRSIDRPIGTITCYDRWAVVRGDEMRMLTLEEIRKAMSFPDDVIYPEHRKTAVTFFGNATCPLQIGRAHV